MEGSIAKLTEEIAAPEAGKKEDGKAMVEETVQRNEDHADHKELTVNNKQ